MDKNIKHFISSVLQLSQYEAPQFENFYMIPRGAKKKQGCARLRILDLKSTTVFFLFELFLWILVSR